MSETANPGDALDPVAMEDDDIREGADERSRMGFLDHLDELRKRIIYSIYAIIAGCILPFWYWEKLYTYLTNYFAKYGGTLIYTRPTGAFMFSLKISLLAGLIIASPFVFSQLWMFVAPGLYSREKRIVIPFVLFSTMLFVAGAAFGHYIAFPSMWQFFASFDGVGGLKFYPTIDETFSFYVNMILGLGAVFQMPLLVFFLARFGIISAKFLIAQFKYAILIIFIIAAVVTPSPDMATQCVFAAPMIGLYVLSIGVAWIFGKRKKQAVE